MTQPTPANDPFRPEPPSAEDRETRLRIAAGRAIAQEYSDRLSHAVPSVADLQLIHRFIFDEVSPDLGELRESETVDVEAELKLLEKQAGEMIEASRTPADRACAIAFWQSRFAVLSPFKSGSDRVGGVVLLTQARELLSAERAFPSRLVDLRATFRVGVVNASRMGNLGPLASTLLVASGQRDEVSFALINTPFRVMPRESEVPTTHDQRYLESITGHPYPGTKLQPATAIRFSEPLPEPKHQHDELE